MSLLKPPKRQKTKPTRLGDVAEEMGEEDRETFNDDVKEMKETARKKTRVAHLKPLMVRWQTSLDTEGDATYD